MVAQMAELAVGVSYTKIGLQYYIININKA